jgi:dCTP deaminase
LVGVGRIKGVDQKNISPASLDLTASAECYRVEGVLLPNPGGDEKQTIRSLLLQMGAISYKESFLSPNEIYLMRLEQTISLPSNLYAYANPKSSTGRNDVHVRLLADRTPRYDTLLVTDVEVELWAVVVPKSYPVIIPTSYPLLQIRFFDRDTRFDELDLEMAMGRWSLLSTLSGDNIPYKELPMSAGDGSVILTLDLESKPIGYKSLRTRRPFNFGVAPGTYNPQDFFEPLRLSPEGLLLLRRDEFYILSTLQAVQVPPELACEMVPMDERSGEFRSHYAGFIDPGWGFGQTGEVLGRPLTLEVRPHEDLIMRHNQAVAVIRFERMKRKPDVIYDSKPSSNYSSQNRAWLSKHFRRQVA